MLEHLDGGELASDGAFGIATALAAAGFGWRTRTGRLNMVVLAEAGPMVKRLYEHVRFSEAQELPKDLNRKGT